MHYTINSSVSTNDGPSGHYELQTQDYINTGLPHVGALTNALFFNAETMHYTQP